MQNVFSLDGCCNSSGKAVVFWNEENSYLIIGSNHNLQMPVSLLATLPQLLNERVPVILPDAMLIRNDKNNHHYNEFETRSRVHRSVYHPTQWILPRDWSIHHTPRWYDQIPKKQMWDKEYVYVWQCGTCYQCSEVASN